MSGEPIIPNPLGWVQFRLLGGWRRIATLTGIYVGAVALLHHLSYRIAKAEGTQLATFADRALWVMGIVMAAVLFFLAPGAIRKAAHRDYTSGMIVSHRTTAMSGHTAVLGYMTGATAQALVLTIVNLFTCIILAAIAGVPPHVPFMLLFVTAPLALLCWALATLLALSTRGTTSIAWVMAILVFLGSADALHFLPGLQLMIGVATAVKLLGMITANPMNAAIFVSALAQLAFTSVFFHAAARKYTGDEVQAFDAPLAYVLLALWTFVAAVGLRFVGTAPAGPVGMPIPGLGSQALATIGAVALVAMLPVASTAKSAARWARRKAKDPGLTAPPPDSYLAAPVLATSFATAILIVVLAPMVDALIPAKDNADLLRRVGWIIATFFFSMAAVAGLLRFTYAYAAKALWATVTYLVLIWALPLFVDLAIQLALASGFEAANSALLACSPVGVWAIACGTTDAPIWPGLILQAVLAAGLLLLARRAKH